MHLFSSDVSKIIKRSLQPRAFMVASDVGIKKKKPVGFNTISTKFEICHSKWQMRTEF